METKIIKCWNCNGIIVISESAVETYAVCPSCHIANYLGGYMLLRCYDCKKIKTDFNACLNCDNTYNIPGWKYGK